MHIRYQRLRLPLSSVLAVVGRESNRKVDKIRLTYTSLLTRTLTISISNSNSINIIRTTTSPKVQTRNRDKGRRRLC
jgi:hypothetical protein